MAIYTIMNKAIYKSLILLVCAILMACQGGKSNTPSNRTEPKGDVRQTTKVRDISLYLYDDFPVQKAQMLADALKEAYPSVSIQKESLVLPKEHYNRERKRYSGTGLLKDLSKLRKGNVVLGLTDEVIFKANELSSTYGIFGVSTLGTYVAVISSTLPSGKQHSYDHQVKLMMHELGHSFGLNHCSNQHCFMVDAEHGNKFSQTPSFCNECKTFLNNKGWKIK
jgi:archaemetzincin